MLIYSSCIAIVDDDESIRRALLRLLQSVGICACTCASGEEFLDLLQNSNPYCVLLDLHLPDLTGFDILARLHRDAPDIPIIIITGHHSAEIQACAMRAKPIAYLTKPVNDQMLLDAIALVGVLRNKKS